MTLNEMYRDLIGTIDANDAKLNDMRKRVCESIVIELMREYVAIAKADFESACDRRLYATKDLKISYDNLDLDQKKLYGSLTDFEVKLCEILHENKIPFKLGGDLLRIVLRQK